MDDSFLLGTTDGSFKGHYPESQYIQSLLCNLIGWTELEAFQIPRGKSDWKNFHRDFYPVGRNILSLHLIWGLTRAKCHVWFCVIEYHG